MDKVAAANRLRLALDMYEVGERMQRQRLRRADPKAGDDEIAEQMQAWHMRRPDAPAGDFPGRVSRRFE